MTGKKDETKPPILKEYKESTKEIVSVALAFAEEKRAAGCTREQAAAELKDMLMAPLYRPEGCPCCYTTPCSSRCTCANPVLSGGCRRCATYGSLEQRQAAAKHIAAILDAAGSTGKSQPVKPLSDQE